jgi:hypothetical protein
MMPNGMDIKIKTMENVEDYEKPLVVKFDVKGAIASSTGKRVLVPADIFEFGAKPAFSHAERQNAVYFPYAYATLDAVRVTYPAGFTVESAPVAENIPYKYMDKITGKENTAAMYEIKAEASPNSLIVRRNLVMGEILFPSEQYPDLYKFFSRFETRDHEPTILKPAPQAASN